MLLAMPVSKLSLRKNDNHERFANHRIERRSGLIKRRRNV